VVEREFIAEGINEAGLSAGLFFFPRYGSYEAYESVDNALTLADLQVVQWMLTQCATIDEVMEAVKRVRIVALEKTSVVHWRIGEPSGRQVVMEIVEGKVESWTDYTDSDQIQVKVNGKIYLVHSNNVVLIKD
jgi:choloylglycine hydrolase